MDKSVKILIGMVIAVVILFILDQIIKPSKVSVSSSDRYITISSEKMPSIYDKLGEKLITEVTDGTDKSGKYIAITYSDIKIDEIASYIVELGNLGYALTESSDNNATLAKEASKDGVILSIAISYSESKTTIKYARGTGTLTRN